MAKHHKDLAERLKGASVGALSPYELSSSSIDKKGVKFDPDYPGGDWSKKIQSFASGTKKSVFFPSSEEKVVRRNNAELSRALKGAKPGSEDVVSSQLASVLEQQLRQTGKSVDGVHPEQARQQQSSRVLESMLAQGGKHGSPEIMLRAMANLSPEAQRQLFIADQASGNRLYQQLHKAKENYVTAQVGKDSRDQPDLQAVFSDVRVESQMATVMRNLQKRDPSGTEARLAADFMQHLEKSGVSWQAQKAFADKLAFKTQVAAIHDASADLLSIQNLGNTLPDRHGRFTGQLYSALAETSGVSDADLAKALNLPKNDLIRTASHAMSRKHEGDSRVAKLISTAVQNDVAAGNKALEPLSRMLNEVDAGRYKASELGKLADEGNLDLNQIEAKLQSDYQVRVDDASISASDRITGNLDLMQQRLDHLRNAEIPNLKDGQLALAQKEANELQSFLAKHPKENFTPEKLKPVVAHFGDNMKPPQGNPLGSKKPETMAIGGVLFNSAMAQIQQINGHREGLEDPNHYATGLSNIMPVLPTAGRSLKDCPWLESTANDMARSAQLVQGQNDEFTLEKSPIIIIDQSDVRNQQLWQDNDAYCRELEQQHENQGLKIVHVSMADVERLAGPELNKMFDTRGDRFAGYGGARNMAYLIAPVIRQCEIEGKDWRTMDAKEALPLIQKHAMETTGVKLFMGDDTDKISQGTMLSKAVLANVHKDEYVLISQPRNGRDTMGVSEGQTNLAEDLLTGGHVAFESGLHGGNKWKDATGTPGMGCTFGDSRFCMDLPLGAEEKQHEAMKSVIDTFSTASHLSGDREKPLGEYFEGHLGYTNSSGMVKALVVNSGAMTWNTEHEAHMKQQGSARFDSLASVMEFASDPEQQKASQKNYLEAMVDWRAAPDPTGMLALDQGPAQALQALEQKKLNSPSLKNYELLKAAYENASVATKTSRGAIVEHYLKTHSELTPETKEQLLKVQAAYEKAGAEVSLCKDYMNRLADQLLPAPEHNPSGSQMKPDDLKRAIGNILDNDPDKIKTAVAQVKSDMESKGVVFKDNRMLRDLHMVTESVGAGGFTSLTQKLTAPSEKLEIKHDVDEKLDEPLVLAAEQKQEQQNDLQEDGIELKDEELSVPEEKLETTGVSLSENHETTLDTEQETTDLDLDQEKKGLEQTEEETTKLCESLTVKEKLEQEKEGPELKGSHSTGHSTKDKLQSQGWKSAQPGGQSRSRANTV